MEIDKTRFLSLVSMLSAGCLTACGAAPSGAPNQPAATPTTTATSSATAAAPAASEVAPSAPPETTPVSAPSAPPSAGADVAKACDEILIGPCGEGGTVRSNCRSIATYADDAQRGVFFACVAQGRSRLTFSDAACGQSVGKCESGRAQCEGVNRQLDACRERASAACTAGADKQMECLQQCMGALQGKSPEAAVAKLEACKKKCGDPDTARGQCERANAQRDCKALEDAQRRCSEQPSRDCDLPPRCGEPLSRACQAGFELMRACTKKMRGES